MFYFQLQLFEPTKNSENSPIALPLRFRAGYGWGLARVGMGQIGDGAWPERGWDRVGIGQGGDGACHSAWEALEASIDTFD